MAQAQPDSEANLHRLRQGTSPFVFAVPLKPRRGCNDWEIVQQRLRHTVRSIRGGVDRNYLIVLACHDRPDLDLGEDVQILSAPFAAEPKSQQGAQDKARKLRMIGAWLKDRVSAEGAHVMFLDSDDLVHRYLVRFVHRAAVRCCYSIERGYMYDCRTGVLELRSRRFFALCGSSFIGWFHKSELPQSWEDLESPYARFGVYPLHRGHQHYPSVAAELGKEVHTIPFPAVTYVVNHGDNLRAVESGMQFRELHPSQLVWPRRAKMILNSNFSYDDGRISQNELARAGSFARALLGSTFRKVERATTGRLKAVRPGLARSDLSRARERVPWR
jgi:hypothetical protein